MLCTQCILQPLDKFPLFAAIAPGGALHHWALVTQPCRSPIGGAGTPPANRSGCRAAWLPAMLARGKAAPGSFAGTVQGPGSGWQGPEPCLDTWGLPGVGRQPGPPLDGAARGSLTFGGRDPSGHCTPAPLHLFTYLANCTSCQRPLYALHSEQPILRNFKICLISSGEYDILFKTF